MAKYEVAYTLRQKILINADSPEAAADMAQSLVSNAIVIINCEIVPYSLDGEVTDVRQLEETALSVLLDKIRNQKPAHKKPLDKKG